MSIWETDSKECCGKSALRVSSGFEIKEMLPVIEQSELERKFLRKALDPKSCAASPSLSLVLAKLERTDTSRSAFHTLFEAAFNREMESHTSNPSPERSILSETVIRFHRRGKSKVTLRNRLNIQVIFQGELPLASYASKMMSRSSDTRMREGLLLSQEPHDNGSSPIQLRHLRAVLMPNV